MSVSPTIAPGALAELVAKWREYAALDQVEVRSAKKALMPMTAVAYDNSATTYTNCANELEAALASLLAAREAASDPPKDLPQRILAKIEQYGGWIELLAFIERAEAAGEREAVPFAWWREDDMGAADEYSMFSYADMLSHGYKPLGIIDGNTTLAAPTPPSLRTGEGDSGV